MSIKAKDVGEDGDVRAVDTDLKVVLQSSDSVLHSDTPCINFSHEDLSCNG